MTREEATCEVCGGTGAGSTHPSGGGSTGDDPLILPCPICGGSGKVIPIDAQAASEATYEAIVADPDAEYYGTDPAHQWTNRLENSGE